jgi:glycosyltransferase involved in cell wall biosynthesis
VDPLVSILIPAYNAQEWLRDTIKSAQAQTWPRKEIIIVNDGSKDQTLAIAKEFKCANVLVVTQENQGAAATRNKAFSLCQGDYVQWLDADDLLGPDKIARQVQAAKAAGNPRILLSGEWARFYYRYHRARFEPNELWSDLAPAEWLIRKLSLNLHMQTATWLVSRELTQAAGPWDTRLLGDDDGEYFCRVLLASDGVRFVPEAKVYYRMSGFNCLSYIGRSKKKIEAQFVSMELHIKYLRSLRDDERVRAACVQYLQNWLPNFYPEAPDVVERAQKLAATLGGKLETPQLSWKYRWIQQVFGSSLARRAQFLLPQLRWSCVRSYDKILSRIDRRELETQAA